MVKNIEQLDKDTRFTQIRAIILTKLVDDGYSLGELSSHTNKELKVLILKKYPNFLDMHCKNCGNKFEFESGAIKNQFCSIECHAMYRYKNYRASQKKVADRNKSLIIYGKKLIQDMEVNK